MHALDGRPIRGIVCTNSTAWPLLFRTVLYRTVCTLAAFARCDDRGWRSRFHHSSLSSSRGDPNSVSLARPAGVALPKPVEQRSLEGARGGAEHCSLAGRMVFSRLLEGTLGPVSQGSLVHCLHRNLPYAFYVEADFLSGHVTTRRRPLRPDFTQCRVGSQLPVKCLAGNLRPGPFLFLHRHPQILIPFSHLSLPKHT